jgi:histidinol-phosphatase
VSADLELALRLADAADAIALPLFGTGLAVERKTDSTPVTEADRAVELELRRLLAEERPGDGVLGEEHGPSGEGPRRWIVDPIDGTRNYARAIPVWATLVALEQDGVVRLGVVSAPALGRRWWAERGEGAFADGRAIRVSSVSTVEDAVVCVAPEDGVPEGVRSAWHVRGFGDFWAHVLVAEGAVDAAFDALGVSAWDLAAVLPIVSEAGGRLTDLSGEARIDGGSALSSNGLLHERLLSAAGVRRSP